MAAEPGVRPGPRRTLSEQTILAAALALLAEKGADHVTIRGIASRVGVAPNGIYTYFSGKAAVLQGLVEQLLGRVNHDRFTDPSLHWRERVHALALDLRAELLAHSGSVHLLLADPLDGPNALAVEKTLLAILADAGLEPDDTVRAAYLLNVHVLGSVALEVAVADEPTSGRRTDLFVWGLDRVLDGLTSYGGSAVS